MSTECYGSIGEATGLDYFLARYYSAAQGRFTSPDEFQGGIVDPFTGQQVGRPGPLPYADITDPQTLNKYPRDGKPFDHVTEVREAAQGLQNQANKIKSMLGSEDLTKKARATLENNLRQANKKLEELKKAGVL